MTLWGEMHEELKNKKTIPNYQVDEYIIHLNNELRGTIVNKKLKKIENKKIIIRLWKTMCSSC